MQNLSYRVDWSLDNGETVEVAYFQNDLRSARRRARGRSRSIGSAYVIATDLATGADIGQIVYWDGIAARKTFEMD